MTLNCFFVSIAFDNTIENNIKQTVSIPPRKLAFLATEVSVANKYIKA